MSNRISKETTVKGDVSVLADVDSEEVKVIEGTTTKYAYDDMNRLVKKTVGSESTIYTLEEGAYFSELTWNEARGLEQTLMYCYHTLNGTNETALLGVNFINGVSPNNKNRENYYNDTIKYIDKYPTYFENQLDNEINNIKEDINYWWK